MFTLENALEAITPRVAALALLRFDAVVEQYHRETNQILSSADKRTIRVVLAVILARECEPAR